MNWFGYIQIKWNSFYDIDLDISICTDHEEFITKCLLNLWITDSNNITKLSFTKNFKDGQFIQLR